ncbi:DM DNA binding domain-containing protein [Ditylenchus destructor]|nr:DM DNA binding domain-containing protein [Ditylenchus destructor]
MSPIPPAGSHKKYCTLCQNHNEQNITRGHKCEYRTCTCAMCEKGRDRQSVVSEAMRVARMKQKGRKRIPKELRSQNPHTGRRGPYKCQRCRNHNKGDVEKKGHKCERAACPCHLCVVAVKRRTIDHDLKVLRNSQVNAAQEPCKIKNLSDNEEISAFTPVNSHTFPTTSEGSVEDQTSLEEIFPFPQLGMKIPSPSNTSRQLQPGLTSVTTGYGDDILASHQLQFNANQIALLTAAQNPIFAQQTMQNILNFAQNVSSIQTTAGNAITNLPYVEDVTQICAYSPTAVSPGNSGLPPQTYLSQQQYGNNFLQVAPIQGNDNVPSAFQLVPSVTPYSQYTVPDEMQPVIEALKKQWINDLQCRWNLYNAP